MRDQRIEELQVALGKVTGKKKKEVKKNLQLAVQVKQFMQQKLWRILKFICNAKQLKSATYKVVEMMQHNGYESTPETKDDPLVQARLAVFVELYASDIRNGLNNQHSYVQGEARRLAFATMNDKKSSSALISAETMLKCALRKVCSCLLMCHVLFCVGACCRSLTCALTFATLYVIHHYPQVSIPGIKEAYVEEDAVTLEDFVFNINKAIPCIAGKDY